MHVCECVWGLGEGGRQGWGRESLKISANVVLSSQAYHDLSLTDCILCCHSLSE